MQRIYAPPEKSEINVDQTLHCINDGRCIACGEPYKVGMRWTPDRHYWAESESPCAPRLKVELPTESPDAPHIEPQNGSPGPNYASDVVTTLRMRSVELAIQVSATGNFRLQAEAIVREAKVIYDWITEHK